MAMNNLNIVRLSALQSEKDMEQELITLVFEFNKQQGLIEKAIRLREQYGLSGDSFILNVCDAEVPDNLGAANNSAAISSSARYSCT